MRWYSLLTLFIFLSGCVEGNNNFLSNSDETDNPAVALSQFYEICVNEFLETKNKTNSTMPIVTKSRDTCVKILSPAQLEMTVSAVLGESFTEGTPDGFQFCLEKILSTELSDRYRINIICVNLDTEAEESDSNLTIQELINAEFPDESF